jgi:hypothetical protein
MVVEHKGGFAAYMGGLRPLNRYRYHAAHAAHTVQGVTMTVNQHFVYDMRYTLRIHSHKHTKIRTYAHSHTKTNTHAHSHTHTNTHRLTCGTWFPPTTITVGWCFRSKPNMKATCISVSQKLSTPKTIPTRGFDVTGVPTRT